MVVVMSVRWLNEEEQRAWRALQFMQMRLTARLAHDIAVTSDLSYSDYLVLVALTDRIDDRMRPFELGAVLSWEKSRVSHQVNRMEARGLVAKERCGLDRRGAFVVATPEGRKAVEAAAPRHVETVRRLFIDRLTPEELETVRVVAERILDGLGDVCDIVDGQGEAVREGDDL
jgi:DNA-binding MarR family transcriptional regulator